MLPSAALMLLHLLATVGGDAPAPIRGLPHDAVLLLLLQIAALLGTARLLGEVTAKLGQPRVVGELVAGIVLGPSMLGVLQPDFQAWLFPRSQHQSDLLAVVGWIGVLFLIVGTGLETDIELIKRRGRSALVISAGGIVVPFATGLALGVLLPEEYVGNAEQRVVFSLFMAVAMSISAVPVLAKVLIDLSLVRRDIGQLMLACAMIDDTVGWVLLAMVAGLATAGVVDPWSIGKSVGGALIFLTVGLTIGAKLVSWMLSVVDRVVAGVASQLSLVLVLAFATAALTHDLGIEAVLGAFVIGILARQAPRFRPEVEHVIQLVSTSFLAPIFFASAGLKVDLLRLGEGEVFLLGLLVLAVACFGKFTGAYAGSAAVGLSHWERLAVGSGMNARGAMEIIVATIGLGLGVLTVEMYSIIVMVAVVTSLMAPPLLRYTLSRVTPGREEVERLARETLAVASFVRSKRRPLLVGMSSSHAGLAARLLSAIAHQQPLEIAAISLRRPAVRTRWWKPWSQTRRRFEELGDLRIDRLQRLLAPAGGAGQVRLVSGPDLAGAALRQAERGHDLLVIAVPTRSPDLKTLLGPACDRLVRSAPCSTILVRTPQRAAPPGGEPWEDWQPKKILVPTTGTETSVAALEVAAVIAAELGATLTLLHVDSVSQTGGTSDAHVTEELAQRNAEHAQKFGARAEAVVLSGTSASAAILGKAAEGYDLLVLGANPRTVDARAFFGRSAETVARQAPCPVVIVSHRR